MQKNVISLVTLLNALKNFLLQKLDGTIGNDFVLSVQRIKTASLAFAVTTFFTPCYLFVHLKE